MAGGKSKKGASKSAANKSAKPAGFDPQRAGLIVAVHEWSLTTLFREVEQGLHVWDPPHPRSMLGSISEFPPLTVRSHVRVTLQCNMPMHFTPRIGGSEKTVTRWSSGWINIYDFVPFRVRVFGDIPFGYWKVECAGLRAWEADMTAKSVTPEVALAIMSPGPGYDEPACKGNCLHRRPFCKGVSGHHSLGALPEALLGKPEK